MRGGAGRQASIMLAVTPDAFVPADHPIRRIKPIVAAALQRLSPLFDTMYSTRGRPSIPSEHPLKASLLIALYSVRSERQFWAGPVISGTRAQASRDPNSTIRSGANSSAMSATILATTGP